MQLHHNDENPANNNPNNWSRLCRKCHMKLHRRGYEKSFQTKSLPEAPSYENTIDEIEDFFITAFGMSKDMVHNIFMEDDWNRWLYIWYINKIKGISLRRIKELKPIRRHSLAWISRRINKKSEIYKKSIFNVFLNLFFLPMIL